MGVDYFVFGGVDSYEYGIDVFFKDIDHTPKRVYEIKEVPGRNGALYIDQNRYEDVSVAYDCIALDDADRKKFVNALAAQTGRKRLQDSFNDDEFYDAVFDGDIDPTVVTDRDKSSFTVYFTRSPQRFLTSGETAVSVEDGDTLTNPTLFEAHPLLMVEGYGAITLNGYEIVINDDVIGELELAPATFASASYACDYRSKSALIDDGDSMVLDSFSVELDIALNSSSGNPYNRIRSVAFSRTNSAIPNYIGVDTTNVSNSEVKKIIKYGEQSFVKQSSDAEYTDSCSVTVSVSDGGVATTDYTFTFDIRIKLQGAGTSQGKGHLLIELRNATRLPSNYFRTTRVVFSVSRFIAISTQSILGHPTYIDCEAGEAYKIINGQLMPLNRYIVLGSKLPTLSVGENEVEYGGLITDLKIVPRWWQI